MKRHNRSYTKKNLLQDESFLRWRYFPTENDELFWKELQKDPAVKAEIDAAIETLNTIRFNMYTLSDNESEAMLDAIGKKIRNKHLRTRRWLYTAGSAAAVILLLMMFFIPSFMEQDTPLLADNPDIQKLMENQNDIQLIAGNESIAIEKDADFLYSESGNITILTDNQEIITDKKMAENRINKLIVPWGKRSSLTLSDGSKIWINSGTVLEFPATFAADKREISVEGEIFIEVTPNENRPFFVNTPDMSVRVLGTSFNISAYREDASSSVVLVEGKVEILSETDKVTLLPEQMASVFQNKIQTEKVDVYNYICWKDGFMKFDQELLSNITTRLMRYYNKTIICQEGTESLTCTGKLILFDNLENVLETIMNTNPVEYTKTDDIFYIKKK